MLLKTLVNRLLAWLSQPESYSHRQKLENWQGEIPRYHQTQPGKISRQPKPVLTWKKEGTR